MLAARRQFGKVASRAAATPSNELDSGNPLILAANGSLLFDIPLPNADQSKNGRPEQTACPHA
jgi:hypothetical protein